MSKIAKRPKSYANMGSTAARLRKYAERIRTQEDLDIILGATPDKAIAAAFVERVKPWLKFTPREPEGKSPAA